MQDEQLRVDAKQLLRVAYERQVAPQRSRLVGDSCLLHRLPQVIGAGRSPSL